LKRLLLIVAVLCVGCTTMEPDRVTLGIQLDADTLQPKTYVVQGQWQIRHDR
jgi:hypothetical protein